MPHPYNHKEWSTCRAKYNYDCKEKYRAKKNRKYEADADDLAKKSSSGNLSLAKIFKYAIATQVMLSNQEDNQLVDDVLNGKFNEDDEVK